MTTLFRFFLVALLLCSAACSNGPVASETGVERPPVAVETSPASAGPMQETIAVVGTLASKFEGEVKTEYSGVIREVFVSEWVRVSRGTLLARFDDREANAALKAATASRLQAEVGATRAQRELERTVKLRQAGLATQQTLDDARTANEAAEAGLAAARAQEEMAMTRLSKAEVRSPMDGVVAARTVNPGDFIENMGSPRPMFRIVDNRRLELTVSVPSSRIASVSVGQPLLFSTEAVPGKEFAGNVTHINPAADEASRTVSVVATVGNDSGLLRAGLFVKGTIVTGERESVLRVPRSALLTWDPVGRKGVLYVVNGDRVQRREVTTGASTGNDIEIAGGVKSGETVVSRGAFNLREGDRVTVANGTGA
jgi:membrane fusion protein (multidrug efflux system)